MFTCPQCANVVGQYPDEGVVTLVCATCTFKFELTGGTVAKLTSRRIEVAPASRDQRAQHVRTFELALASSPRETVRFTFETDRDDDWIQMGTGDRAVVVCSMRLDVREELLFIVDRTSGERFVLAKPGQRSRARALLYGALIGVVSGTGAVALSLPFAFAGGIALLAGAATTGVLRHVLTPRHALGSDERSALTGRQALLRQKDALLRLRGAVIVDVESRRALEQRLRSLRARMVAVKLDAYAERIEDIDRALRVLDEQLRMDAQLTEEYDRTVQVLEIEYDTSLAADSIQVDGDDVMEARLAALREVEELRNETTRRLAANAEVEALLRSHSS
ncbi:hypothetical protein BH11GEM1_BH11GEM1_04050 [soil metagenome]